MKAWLLDSLRGIDTLRLAEVDDPTPGNGEALLAVEYAALNPADRYLAMGQYPARPPLPHVLGRDAVARILSLGSGAADFAVGEHVAVLRGEAGVDRWGTLAQKVVVGVDSLIRLPRGWTHAQASGATLVYLTAYQALTQFADLPENATVLVSGASGGVGVATLQLCRAMKLNAIALSRGTAKSAALSELGASEVLDVTSPTWSKSLRERVDLYIDNIGGDLFNDALGTLAHNGRISCIGRLAGPVPSFNTAGLFFRRVQIRGVAVADYAREEAHAAWRQVVSLLAQINAKPLIDQVFEFSQVPAAFARLEAGPMGKVLVRVNASAEM